MIDFKRKVTRKISNPRRLRHPLIIQLDPQGILRLREKSGRHWYSIGLEELYVVLVAAEIKKQKCLEKIH
jgi:hypothetical protein